MVRGFVFNMGSFGMFEKISLPKALQARDVRNRGWRRGTSRNPRIRMDSISISKHRRCEIISSMMSPLCGSD